MSPVSRSLARRCASSAALLSLIADAAAAPPPAAGDAAGAGDRRLVPTASAICRMVAYCWRSASLTMSRLGSPFVPVRSGGLGWPRPAIGSSGRPLAMSDGY